MISGINGFNANVNYDFSSAHERNLKAREEKEAINLTSNLAPSRSNLTEPIDYYALDPDKLDENELAVWAQNVEFSKLNDKQQNRLLAIKMGFKKPVYKPYDPVVARKAYSLSGYTEDDKISVWGKINGLDPSMSKGEVAELKKFIDDSGALGLERAFGDSETLSVNEFIKRYTRKHGFSDFTFGGTKTAELLDSDMSVDEFKANWTKFALKKRFGLELDEELAKETINSINDLEAQNEEENKENKFTPIQVTKKSQTYKLEADERFKEIYKFIKSEFDSGKSMFEILEKVAKLKVDKRA